MRILILAGIFRLEVKVRFCSFIIEIDNDERGVIGDFTMISDIRITKAEPEIGVVYLYSDKTF